MTLICLSLLPFLISPSSNWNYLLKLSIVKAHFNNVDMNVQFMIQMSSVLHESCSICQLISNKLYFLAINDSCPISPDSAGSLCSSCSSTLHYSSAFFQGGIGARGREGEDRSKGFWTQSERRTQQGRNLTVCKCNVLTCSACISST